MKPNKMFALLLFFTFSLSINIFAQTDAEAERYIRDQTQKMAQGMVSGDYDFMHLYTDDAVSMPSYEPMVRGKAELESSMQRMSESGMKMNSFELTTEEVRVRGDVAYEIGTYKLNMNMPNMEQAIDDNGKYLTVWERVDGEWKVAAEMWNTDLNPWMGMMEDHH
jgi:uncharacterized protein (TIGR02246 family)